MANRHTAPPLSAPVIFFDGVCGLCNRFVDGLLKADKAGRFRFSPLQGETAASLLREKARSSGDPTSIVLWDQGTALEKSDAVLKIAERLGGTWRFCLIGRWMPRQLRDGLYDFIARHRYGWFGKSDTCRLPSAEERSRFLP